MACASCARASRPDDVIVVNGLQQRAPGHAGHAAARRDGRADRGGNALVARTEAGAGGSVMRCELRTCPPGTTTDPSGRHMKFSSFFIDRPIFAAVLSAFILIAGAIALFKLPISEYPEVVPPSVVVRATYPGANPKVIAETVAAPLEQEIIGVENMLYMSSQATIDGTLALTVTFKHRHGHRQRAGAGAEPRRAGAAAPARGSARARRHDAEELARPHDGRASHVARRPLRLAVSAQLRDAEHPRRARAPARHGRRARVRRRRLRHARVARSAEARRAQSRRPATSSTRSANRTCRSPPGQIGAPPAAGRGVPARAQRQGPPRERGGVRRHRHQDRRRTARSCGCGDVARVELGAGRLRDCVACSTTRTRSRLPIFQAPGSNALELSDKVRDDDGGAEARVSRRASTTTSSTTRPLFVRQSIDAVVAHAARGDRCWSCSSSSCSCRPGARRSSRWSRCRCRSSARSPCCSRSASRSTRCRCSGWCSRSASWWTTPSSSSRTSSGTSPTGWRRARPRKQAMSEVSRPIIAITLVLCAVFVPVAFVERPHRRVLPPVRADHRDLDGDLGVQLADAVARRSPRVLLKPHGAKPDALTRGMDKVFGGFFARFNRVFAARERRLLAAVHAVRSGARRIAIAIYAGLIALTAFGFYTTAGGLHPAAGQAVSRRHRAAAARGLDRSHRRGRAPDGRDRPSSSRACSTSVQFAGVSANGFAASSSAALVFFPLKDFDERKGKELSAGAIAGALNQKFSRIQDAYIAVFPPPPVIGLGTLGGFKLNVEDRAEPWRRGAVRAPCSRRSARPDQDPRSPACSPATRSTCRSSTSTSIASRPSSRA